MSEQPTPDPIRSLILQLEYQSGQIDGLKVLILACGRLLSAQQLRAKADAGFEQRYASMLGEPVEDSWLDGIQDTQRWFQTQLPPDPSQH